MNSVLEFSSGGGISVNRNRRMFNHFAISDIIAEALIREFPAVFVSSVALVRSSGEVACGCSSGKTGTAGQSAKYVRLGLHLFFLVTKTRETLTFSFRYWKRRDR